MKINIPKKDPRELGLFRFFVTQHVVLNMVYIGVFVGGAHLVVFPDEPRGLWKF